MTDELDLIADQDERIKHHLSRKDKITTLMKNNRSHLEQSLISFDQETKNTRGLSVSPGRSFVTNGRKYTGYE
jgi:hypothetical protein